MKNRVLLSLVLIFILAIVGCTQPENEVSEPEASEPVAEESVAESEVEEEPVVEEKTELKIATLKGPTGMGMVQLMENDEAGTSQLDYTFEVLGAPDQIIGLIVQGKVDIAAVPTNLAAILDVKTENNVQLLGVNTLGVLFAMENGDEITSLDDLEGKTILSAGKGASPEFVLNYLLSENGLTDSVTVEYAVEHAEVAAKLNSGDAEVVLLPQPFVTSTLLANENARISIDITNEWSKATEGMVLPMGAVIVNKNFAEQNPDAVAIFMEEYKASVEFVNSKPQDAGVIIEKFGILPKAALATKAIPNSNIVLMDAQEAKNPVMKYYEILFGFAPTSVGGKIPSEDFFYNK